MKYSPNDIYHLCRQAIETYQKRYRFSDVHFHDVFPVGITYNDIGTGRPYILVVIERGMILRVERDYLFVGMGSDVVPLPVLSLREKDYPNYVFNEPWIPYLEEILDDLKLCIQQEQIKLEENSERTEMLVQDFMEYHEKKKLRKIVRRN